MFRSLAFGKLATAAVLMAVPLATTGCQTAGTKGWGWSPPSMSSLNPWKSSSDSQLANNSKPSSVPTPPPQMLSGQGLARGGSQGGNSNSYASSQPGAHGGRSTDPYAARGGNTNSYNASDYATRQASATQGEGYDTGRYATGGYGQAQTGPYGSGGAGGYGSGAATSTADRRSDSAYGAGAGGNTGWQNYNQSQPQNNRSTYEGYNNGAANSYQGAAGGQSSSPNSSSPYSGATGVSGGTPRSSSTPAVSYGADAYRPGSTARAAEIQPASFEKSSGSSEGNYPTTPAGDDSGYQ